VASWRRKPATDGGNETIAGYGDLHRIGRGGFSVVYRARQEALDRVVALKVLSVDFIDSSVRRRFLREVKLTSKLTGHPNVVTVLDSGMTAAGSPYIAMEYFERGSMRDRLLAEGPLPVADVLRVGVKIAGALAAAHAEGVLHRDVKPQNILVSRFGEPALADFGTARLTDSLDMSSRTEALTPHHAAPEILRGELPTPSCDVYSLGSTLYHLLAGRPAYASIEGGVAALLLRVLAEDVPPISRPDVPPGVVATLRTAMAKLPSDRFPDAIAFAQALQRLQVQLGLPITELGDAPSLPADQRPAPSTTEPTEAAQQEPEQPVRRVVPRPVPVQVPALTQVLPDVPDVPDEPSERLASGPAAEGHGRRRTLVLLVVVLALVAVALPLALQRFIHSGSTRPGSAATLAATTAPKPTADLRALRPTGLAVTQDGGAAVALHWTLAAGTAAMPVYLRILPPVPGRSAEPLPAGTTAYTVTGLSPSLGYCFQVGPIVTMLPQLGIALSDPLCIRGAFVATSSTP
jgi:serine/threonine protein kinase